MTVVTSNLSDVNVFGQWYDISLQIKLADYPMVAAITKTFKITITCTVTTLAYTSNPPANTALEVGVDPDPYDMSFAISKTPNCVQNPTFTLVSTPAASFASRTINVDGVSGYVRISGETLSNLNSYSMTLTAAVDAQTTPINFTVVIKDPCKRAVFQTNPSPLSDMTIIMPSSGIQTQNVKIYTDVEVSHNLIICPITASLSTGALYINLAGNYASISIDKSKIILPTDIGDHSFTLIVNEKDWSSFVAQQAYTFTVHIVCTVSTLTITSQAADKYYILNQGPFATNSLQISQTDACQFAYSYTHVFTKNGSTITAPAWISFVSATTTFAMTITLPADVGVYTVTTTSTIPQIDPITNLNRITTSVFTITVVSDCTLTSFTDKIITNMTYGVTAPALTQNIFFADSIASGHSSSNYCGLRTYVISPLKPFMSIASDVLSIQTSDETFVASYIVTLTVTLTDYPAISSIVKVFTVKITCSAQVVSFVAPLIPAFTTVQVGIDSQPLVVPFATHQFPNCGNAVTFTLNINTDPFMTLETLTNETGDWKVHDATIAQHATYSYALTAAVDGQTTTANFQVFIKDPCSTSVFELTPNPMTNMSIILYYLTTETKTQTVKIWTDVERAHPAIICPITATLTPILPYITLAADFKSILLDGSKASDPDNGLYTMTLTVKNKVFPGQVAPAVYTFVLDLQACVVNNFLFAQQVSSMTYMLTNPVVTTPAVLATQSNLNCLFPITYATNYSRAGAPIAMPAYISFDPVVRNFKTQTSSKSDIGVYNVVVNASIPQILLPGGKLTISFMFTVTIESDCKISVINDRPIINMKTEIYIHALQDVTFTNTRSQLHGDVSHCGAYKYVLNPTYDFLQLTGTGPFTLDLYTTDIKLSGNYPTTLTVSLPDFPMIPALSYNFVVKLICNILSVSVPRAPAAYTSFWIQSSPYLEIPFTIIDKPDCLMSYTLTPAPSTFPFVVDVIPDRQVVIVSTNNLHDEGVYSMTLQADPMPGESIGFSSPILSFQFELINICKTTKFMPFTVQNLEILSQDPAFSLDNPISYGDLTTQAQTLNGVNCGAINVQVVSNNPGESLPKWMTNDPVSKQLSVNLSAEKTPYFTKTFKLVAFLVEYPKVQYTTQPFNVTLSTANFGCLSNTGIKFTTGDAPLQFGILYTNNTVVSDKIKLTQIVEPVAFNDNNVEISMPGFIQFKQSSLQFIISNPPYESIGSYQFGIRLGYKQYPQTTVTCMKPAEIKYITKFDDQPAILYVIPCEQPYEMQLPEFRDVFKKKATVDFESQTTVNFLVFDQNSRTFKTFSGNATCDYEGRHKGQLIITDSVEKSLTYDVDIVVTKVQPKASLVIDSNSSTTQIKLPPPTPKIQYIDQLGRVRVSFNRPIVVPNFDIYPVFYDGKHIRSNCTNGDQETCTTTGNGRSLAQILSEQDKLQQSLDIINKGLVSRNKTMYPVIELSMLPGSDLTDSQAIQQFTWECVDFKPEYIDFQIMYKYHPEISIHETKDVLQVKFNGNEFFKTPDGQMIQATAVKTQKIVPIQIDPQMGQSMVAAGSVVGDAGKAVAIGNFIMNMFLGGILQELLSALSKLQIMLHLLIINVLVPAHAMIYFQGLLGLVTFQIYDFSDLLIRLFGLVDQSTLEMNPNLYYLGYNSTYFILNMGNIFLYLVLQFIIILFIVITHRVKNKRILGVQNQAKNLLIWNGIYKSINEPYVVFVVSCMTQTFAMYWTAKGQTINNLLMILTFAAVICFPFWTFFLLRRNSNRLHQKDFIAKYQSIYEHLKLKDANNWVLLEPCISSFRMLITCGALMYLRNFRTFQIMIAMIFHFFVLIYNGQVMPFKDSTFYFFQQFNEIFVFWTLCVLMTFADLIFDQYAKDTMGWILITIVTANLIINFGHIIGKAIKKNCRKYYIQYLVWRRNRLRNSVEEKHASMLAEQQRLADKAELSPRSIRIWHQIRKELGMTFDMHYIEDPDYSFNSEAELILADKKRSSDEARILNRKNLKKMTRHSRNVSANVTAYNISAAVLVPEDDEAEMERRRHYRRGERESMQFLIQNEYVVSPLTQQRMNEFYGQNPEAAKTFDPMSASQMPGDETAYASERYWGQPQMNRTAATMMYNDEDAIATTFEKKNYDMRKQKDATNDNWGLPEPHTPLQQRMESNESIKNSYIQKHLERDDSISHSYRVQQRQEQVRNAVKTPDQARQLFDELWKSMNDEEEVKSSLPDNESHFIAIKTHGPDLQVSVAPAHKRAETEQNWWGRRGTQNI